MLIDDSQMSESLRQMAARFTADLAQRDDLMQECLINLWKVEQERPGQTRSWYLQNCRFHLQHCLMMGRSLDSTKRCREDTRVTIEDSEVGQVPEELHTNGELFEAVSFRDVVSTLARHLKPREQVVLRGLSEGLALAEIGAKFGMSYPSLLKYRHKIALLISELGISQPLSPLKQTQQKRPAGTRLGPGSTLF